MKKFAWLLLITWPFLCQSADIVDSFTAPDETELGDHTGDSGQTYPEVPTEPDVLYVIRNNILEVNKDDTVHVSYISTIDLSSADQQVWFQLKSLFGARDMWVGLRTVATGNFIGWRMKCTVATCLEIFEHNAFAQTELCSDDDDDPVVDGWYRITAKGNVITLWSGGSGPEPADPTSDDNWTEECSGISNAHLDEQSVGIMFASGGSSGTGPWIDDIRWNIYPAVSVSIPAILIQSGDM